MENNDFSWDEIIDSYLDYLRCLGRSDRTVRLHLDYLNKVRCISTPKTITYCELEKVFKVSWKSETRRSAFNIYRKFFHWLYEFGYRSDDVSKLIGKVKMSVGVPKPIPEDVLAVSLSRAGEREKIMILLGAYLGLRCCEICKIHADDFDGKGLRVVGKGGKQRYIPVVHPYLIGVLNNLECGYLFPSVNSPYLSAGRVSKLIRQNLVGGWTAHSLRHRMATKTYSSSKDLLATSILLGHSSPSTTKRYVQVCDDYLFSVMKNMFENL